MIIIFTELADVAEPVATLYPDRFGVFTTARKLPVADALMLPPSIRAEWAREMGVRLGRDGKPFISGRVGSAWRDPDGTA